MNVFEIIRQEIVRVEDIPEDAKALLEMGYYLAPYAIVDWYELKQNPPELFFRLYDIPMHLLVGYMEYYQGDRSSPSWYQREFLNSDYALPTSGVWFFMEDIDYTLAC